MSTPSTQTDFPEFMVLVQGKGHEYQPHDNVTLVQDRHMKVWVSAWTTRNNTLAVTALSEDEALRKWFQRRFAGPADHWYSDELLDTTVQFTVEITQFCNGVESQRYDRRYFRSDFK